MQMSVREFTEQVVEKEYPHVRAVFERQFPNLDEQIDFSHGLEVLGSVIDETVTPVFPSRGRVGGHCCSDGQGDFRFPD